MHPKRLKQAHAPSMMSAANAAASGQKKMVRQRGTVRLITDIPTLQHSLLHVFFVHEHRNMKGIATSAQSHESLSESSSDCLSPVNTLSEHMLPS